jgi:hypothetical protein
MKLGRGYFRIIPMIKLTKKMTINTKNRILAISDAPAAMPLKPKTAATSAMMKKMTAHFNILTSIPGSGFVWIGEEPMFLNAHSAPGRSCRLYDSVHRALAFARKPGVMCCGAQTVATF